MIYIFTDGACSGNPGPGGWGVLIKGPEQNHSFYGYNPCTTNNRMELMGAIEALRYIHTTFSPSLHTPIILHSDSRYLTEGMTKWIHQWVRNGWKTSQKKSVENQDLWKELINLVTPLPQLSWQWIQGHAGHPENEAVDRLARQALKQGILWPDGAERTNLRD